MGCVHKRIRDRSASLKRKYGIISNKSHFIYDYTVERPLDDTSARRTPLR
jgi:hypothetical protein